MPCISSPRLLAHVAALWLLMLAVGCASPPGVPARPAPAAASSPVQPSPAVKAQPGAPDVTDATLQAILVVPNEPGASPAGAPRDVELGPPGTPRSWEELRLQAAQRMVAAHPDTSYVAKPPAILLAIPVLEIELNADGSVRHIRVVRVPTQAQDTTQVAIAAVRRAAPYGDVSRLKKPWKFTEVFLFDGDRRFMPRTLDQ